MTSSDQKDADDPTGEAAQPAPRPGAADAVDFAEPAPLADTDEDFARSIETGFGVPRREVHLGDRTAERLQPWRTPLERATQPPPLVPMDSDYDEWLRATLADV